jgi:aminopeptidase N
MKHAIILYLLVCTASVVFAQSEKHYTKDDTLRGLITAARAWWDVHYYHLDVRVEPPKKMIDGSVRIDYRVLHTYPTMQIDLQPPLEIHRVVQDNESLSFARVGTNAYHIQLKKHQQANALESITVYYGGAPRVAKNPPWDGGFQFVKDADGYDFIATSCQGIGASIWWPNKDHSSEEPDSMRITATVPRPLMNVSNGRLLGVVENPDSTRTFDWFVSNPINNYGVNLNIGHYIHWSDTLHGKKGILDLDFYVLPYNEEKGRKQFVQAKMMLKAFEHWFGPYPFYEDGFKLVETPYLGMEHQSSVTYGNGFSNGYLGRDLSNTGWGLKFDFIIIHESGHEWFANNITYKDAADMWIHESFTNYAEALYLDYYFGKEAATDYVVGIRSGIQNDKPIIGEYNVNKRGSKDMYNKGGNVLHTLRHSIADDVLFRDILRGLNETFYHQTVTSKQIEDYISQRSGYDYTKFFDQYLRSTLIPEFQYAWKGKKLSYRWANCVEGFHMPIQVMKDKKTIRLMPSTDLKTVKLKKKDRRKIDADWLERQYYINVKAM